MKENAKNAYRQEGNEKVKAHTERKENLQWLTANLLLLAAGVIRASKCNWATSLTSTKQPPGPTASASFFAPDK